MSLCPRCLQQGGDIHTCTPTPFVASLERKIAALKVAHDAMREAAYTAGMQAERAACMQIVEREAAQYAEPVWAVEILNDMSERGET